MSIRLSQSAEDEVFDEVKRTWERTYERKVNDLSAKNSICNYVFKRVCGDMEEDRVHRMGQTEFDTIKRVMGRKVDEHFQGGRQQTADRRRDDDRPKYNAHERDHHRGGGGGYGGNGGHSGNGGYGGNGNRNGGHGGNGNGGYGHGNGGNDRGYGGGNGGGYGGSNGATHGNGNPGRRPREEEANGGDGGGGGTFVLPPASQRQATGDGILRRLPVLTNCARIKVDPTLVAYHYDVTFIPEIKDEDRRRGLIKEMLGEAVPYDGNKILYSARERLTPADAKEGVTVEVPANSTDGLDLVLHPDDLRRKTVAQLRCTSEKSFAEFPKKLDVNADPSRSHLAVLDITLKQAPCMLYRAMSDAFFDERREAAWSSVRDVLGKYELWTGYRQSVIVTEKGAVVQFDSAFKAAIKSCSLIKFFADAP